MDIKVWSARNMTTRYSISHFIQVDEMWQLFRSVYSDQSSILVQTDTKFLQSMFSSDVNFLRFGKLVLPAFIQGRHEFLGCLQVFL